LHPYLHYFDELRSSAEAESSGSDFKLLALGSKMPHHSIATVQIRQKQRRSRHHVRSPGVLCGGVNLLSRSEEPMLKSKGKVVWWVAGLIPFVVASSGCATKKYVRNQVDPVSQHVDALETQTNEKIAAVSAKHESDMSQVNERISSTDLRVTQLSAAVQQAQGTASRALDQAKADANRSETNLAVVAPTAPLNYQLVDKADVMFAFNKSSLSNDTKSALDQLAQKAQSVPGAMVEIAGFTDKTGTPSYNLALSRRRAEAVQLYLAKQNVSVGAIHIIGFGEIAPPASLQADITPGQSKAQVSQMERRVRVQILSPSGDGSAARSQQ
jgi:outer membrane protein OmpA-like peptidoglycan-associated protein